MPDVPPPEALVDEHTLRLREIERMPIEAREWALRPRPIEIRPVKPRGFFDRSKSEPFDDIWIRATGQLPAGISRFNRPCSPMHLTCRCSILPCCRMASIGIRACRWQASIMPCGFTDRSGSMTGCFTHKTAPALRVHGASIAGRFIAAMAISLLLSSRRG